MTLDLEPSPAPGVTTRFAPAVITEFLPGTRRSRRKGPFGGWGLSGRLWGERFAISKNLIRLRATGMRSPVGRPVQGPLVTNSCWQVAKCARQDVYHFEW